MTSDNDIGLKYAEISIKMGAEIEHPSWNTEREQIKRDPRELRDIEKGNICTSRRPREEVRQKGKSWMMTSSIKKNKGGVLWDREDTENHIINCKLRERKCIDNNYNLEVFLTFDGP